MRGFEKGKCPLCRVEDVTQTGILLKCSETKKWREQFLVVNGVVKMKT
jgi:hypothetical protein